jgi:hypothetical protein
MTSAELFVGEMPVVRASVTAPRERPLDVMRSNRSHFTTFFRADLISAEGRVPGGPPTARRDDEPDDFVFLPAGQTVSLSLPILARPPKPGKYTVQVIFRPTPDRALVYEGRLVINVKELRPADILGVVPIEVPSGANLGAHPPSIDLVKVKEGGKVTLCYRKLGQQSLALNRLLELDPAATVRADVSNVDALTNAGTVRIIVQDNRQRAVIDVDYFTGAVIKRTAKN